LRYLSLSSPYFWVCVIRLSLDYSRINIHEYYFMSLSHSVINKVRICDAHLGLYISQLCYITKKSPSKISIKKRVWANTARNLYSICKIAQHLNYLYSTIQYSARQVDKATHIIRNILIHRYWLKPWNIWLDVFSLACFNGVLCLCKKLLLTEKIEILYCSRSWKRNIKIG